MTCNLCSYRTEVNEARDEGADTWLEEQEPYGFNLFVIPKGSTPRIRLERDETYGPQRKAWFNEMPDTCECGQQVKLQHPESTWKPDTTTAPEPVEEPMRLREQGETVVNLNLL